MKISAVIITYNAGQTIEPCLQSLLAVADEIIVIDSFSTDATKSICLDQAVKFFERTFKGYGQQKNFGIAQATHDYILSLDADEHLSVDLQQAILKLKQDAQNIVAAYEWKRINLYKSKPVKFGIAKPEMKMRLWNKNSGLWNNDEVHEKVVFNKTVQVGFLKGYMMHIFHDNLESLQKKHNHYAKLGASQLFKNDKQSSFTIIHTKKIHAFVKAYFFKLGCLDLNNGFELAKEFSRYTSLKYTLLHQMNQTKK